MSPWLGSASAVPIDAADPKSMATTAHNGRLASFCAGIPSSSLGPSSSSPPPAASLGNAPLRGVSPPSPPPSWASKA